MTASLSTYQLSCDERDIMAWAVTANGHELHYEDVGSGPVLVFVSGYMGIADIWKFVVPSLSSDFRCISYDRRGYGRSSKYAEATSRSVQDESADLQQILKAAGVDKDIALIAHSMGGSIATAFYTDLPASVSRIIYISCTIDAKVAVQNGLSIDLLVQNTSTPSDSQRFYENIGLQSEIAIEAAKWPPLTFRNNAVALVNANMGEELSQVKIPALLIWGDNDLACPVKPFGMDPKSKIPDSRLEILGAVNHFPQTEAPEKVVSFIRGFMGEK